MALPEKTAKLIVLTSKAETVNKELLKEEEKFVAALKEDQETGLLESMIDRISALIRKENLFIGAVKSNLKRLKQQ